MRNILEIKLKPQKFCSDEMLIENPSLNSTECKHILDKIGLVTEDEMSHAVDTLITWFYQERVYKLDVDISERDRLLGPPKEMTIEDIEKALGYKVKIIGGKRGER